MEPQLFDNSLYSPPFQLPEDSLFPSPHRFVPAAASRQQNSLIAAAVDQSLESAFSLLNLASDARFASQDTSGYGFPAGYGGGGGAAASMSVPPPMAYGGSQAQNWAAQGPSANGPFCLPGARQEINVGPDFWGGGPYLHAADHGQLVNYNQRLDFYEGAETHNLASNFLHGTEYLPRNARYNVPASPFSRNSSSANSLYAEQQLYNHERRLTPETMVGNVVHLAKDQVWSNVLASKMEEGMSENEIEMILVEVMDYWDDLLRNQFGSQFVQSLFSVCNEDQRTRIIMALTRFPFMLISICLNTSGAKAMLKLLEKLNTPQQISLVVASVIRGAYALSIDTNGQHIVNYCIKRFPREYTKFLLNEITNHCFRIATTKSGCCVIQSCVENCRGEARNRNRLIDDIIENVVHLAEDPYGNYVVQHLLGMKMQNVTKDVLERFQGGFVSLSCSKYASNVVEKLLQMGEEVSGPIIIELLRSPDASMLLVDPFGNFVIQTALSASRGKLHDYLVSFIQMNSASMQSNLYGKKILAWFDKRKHYGA